MRRINIVHLVGGGLLAGLVINIYGGIVFELFLADAYTEQLGQALPRRAIPAAMMLGYLVGIVAVWCYASIRSHYGRGGRTAVIAGVMIWSVGYAMPNYALWYSGLLDGALMAVKSAVGLPEFVLATLAGAWVYDRPTRNEATADRAVRA